MRILNLTQHVATQYQIEDGVVEPVNKDEIRELLTFDDLPTRDDIRVKAARLAGIAFREGVSVAMIGGAPFLLSELEKALIALDIVPVYSFSIRESVEVTNDDGSVTKTNVFKHKGFISNDSVL